MALTDPGSFCWFELGTTDQTAAKAFYASLFGWDAHDTPLGPDEAYTVFKHGGRDAAACYTIRQEQRDQGVPPHWMIYVTVADADAGARRAAELGGTVIVQPFDVSDLGRMAVLQDPTGATFSIWQAKSNPGAGVWGEPGSACWGDLSTPDQGRAGRFYRDLFGWRMVAGKDLREAQPGEYFHIMNGAEMIGGIPPPEQRNPHAPPHWLIYFEAASCHDATDRARALGATAHLENMEIGEDGYVSVLADPQGAVFGIHARQR
jgi:predicted enzyme related to lactoylglutathione lyase